MNEKLDVLDRAIIYATEKHSGACRKAKNNPYILHPLEAAAIAGSITDDREIIAAAVLHDTIEDTSATAEEIQSLFGGRVCGLLLSDTEDKMRDIPSDQSWKARKQATLDFLDHATREEQIICLADKLSNLREIYRDYVSLGDAMFARFNNKNKKDHEWYYRGVGERLSHLKDTVAYQEYRTLLDKVFEKLLQKDGVNIKQEVESFAIKNGYDTVKFRGEWNGYQVYEPKYRGRGTAYVGLPLVILVNDDEIRMSTDVEAMAFLDYATKGKQ